MNGVSSWINVCSWTGRTVNRLPKAGRATGEDYAYIGSLMAVIGDRWCHPHSGGIAKNSTLAEIYGVGVEQFRRNILPTLSYVRMWGDVAITNESSAYANAKVYRANTKTKWFNNLYLSMDVTSGYCH